MTRRNEEAIKKVKQYRDKQKLSFREIGKLLEADVKTVFRWYNYKENTGVGKLSTGKLKV